MVLFRVAVGMALLLYVFVLWTPLDGVVVYVELLLYVFRALGRVLTVFLASLLDFAYGLVPGAWERRRSDPVEPVDRQALPGPHTPLQRRGGANDAPSTTRALTGRRSSTDQATRATAGQAEGKTPRGTAASQARTPPHPDSP